MAKGIKVQIAVSLICAIGSGIVIYMINQNPSTGWASLGEGLGLMIFGLSEYVMFILFLLIKKPVAKIIFLIFQIIFFIFLAMIKINGPVHSSGC